MKNKEKHLDELADVVAFRIDRCAFREKHVLKASCKKGVYADCEKCNERTSAWLEEEYVELEIDWLKVPPNTPVMVRNDGYDEVKRLFAIYTPCAMMQFRTFSEDETHETSHGLVAWEYCRLADGVDPTPFLKGE